MEENHRLRLALENLGPPMATHGLPLPPPGTATWHSAPVREDPSHGDLKEEIHLARRIQLELLPRSCPKIEGYDVFATSLPARFICGDYFDFVPLEEGKHAICLGDVCGKGLSASLLMANLQAIIRTQSLYNPPGHDCLARCRSFFIEPAKQCIERSNGLLFRCTPPERFVTLFYGILDPSEQTLRFCNAGHNPPLHLSGDRTLRLKTGGIPLGIKSDWSYKEDTVPMAPGDLVVMYSDGIIEAQTPQGLELGEGGLTAIVQQLRGESAENMAMGILSAVEAHLQGAPPADDISLVCIRRLPI